MKKGYLFCISLNAFFTIFNMGRFVFLWQHGEPIMPCYSYEPRVATSLDKNVDSTRWGCAAPEISLSG